MAKDKSVEAVTKNEDKSAEECKKWLALLWFPGAGIIFFFIMLRTLGGHYPNQVNEVVGWLLPNLVPTLSLMMSVFVADALQQENRNRQTINSFIFRLSFGVSALYLVALLLVIIMGISTDNPLEAMKVSGPFLGPFQGLVTASLGIFFIKRKN